MIKIVKKDITTVTRGIIMHGCNSHGVMGSGVAAAIRKKWPCAFDTYSAYIKRVRKQVALETPETEAHYESIVWANLIGRIPSVQPPHEPDLLIVNAITQQDFGSNGGKYASLDAIETALTMLTMYVEDVYAVPYGLERPTIYLPKIGAGLGGLDWDTEVYPLLKEYAIDLYPHIDFIVCTVD